MIYHVSVNGSDRSIGSADAPFQTINKAARIARPGDVVKVHGGTYREWVDPVFGGTSEHNRIIYEAAEGEHPIIKGSEVITGWEHVKDCVWKVVLQNSFFGEWNPFEKEVEGDWVHGPLKTYHVHLGDVYINGESMFEAVSVEDLYSNEERKFALYEMPGDPVPIPNYERTRYKWLAAVDFDTTTIYCNFAELDPNRELIEINVRPCCFFPKRTGINYITLRGFEIAHAASPWIPPTVHQIAMVGPNWSRGWLIENNDMHDAKCSAISLGKDAASGDDPTRLDRKSGHRHQLEAVFAAVRNGWNKDTVGSHIVRNNEIHDCGQNAIVGHLGCIFSRITHNHVYNISTKHEFWGSEQAGIKFHGAIDTLVENNLIHDCTLGTWLDWQAQGIRLSGNIYHSNLRDIEIEVSHGPCLVDNNLFLSSLSFDCFSQGNALVHNLFAGNMSSTTVLDRTTPYHFPHSTDVAGYSEILGGDDRFFNNLFVGQYEPVSVGMRVFEDFSKHFDKYSNEEEYKKSISSVERGNLGKFVKTPQPIWVKGNAYSGLAKPSRHDPDAIVADGLTVELNENDGKLELTVCVPEALAGSVSEPVTTKRLGETRLSAMAFEAPDGSDLDFSKDMLGKERNGWGVPGPFASLKSGKQTFTVWKKNTIV